MSIEIGERVYLPVLDQGGEIVKTGTLRNFGGGAGYTLAPGQ
jgi:hypothetical protein